MMFYTVRPMESGDVPTVAAIERLSFPTPWPGSAFSHELRQTRSHYYVLSKPAEGRAASAGRGWRRRLRQIFDPPEESQVIGYVGFRFQSSEAHISTIAVHLDWRGKGLGELLLLTALEQALKQRADLVTLEMRASNQVAHHLYCKYGFQSNGTLPKYYQDGEDARLMAVTVNDGVYRARLAGLRQELEARLCRQRIDVGQNEKDTL